MHVQASGSFICFSCLIALAAASGTILHINGKSGHLAFFLILAENFQSFTFAHDASCGLFVYGFYYVKVLFF